MLMALQDITISSLWLVYSTPTTCIRSIDAMYVGCRYPGAAADRPPKAPPSKYPGAAKRSRSLISAMPGEAFPYLCDWEHGAGGWENMKNCNREGKSRRTESQQDEERNKRKRRSADEFDPEKSHHAMWIANLGILRRCHTKSHWYPCCRRATLLGGGGNLGSHNSP